MPPARLELTTPGLGILCSIHLSYGGESASYRKIIFVVCQVICYHLFQFRVNHLHESNSRVANFAFYAFCLACRRLLACSQPIGAIVPSAKRIGSQLHGARISRQRHPFSCGGRRDMRAPTGSAWFCQSGPCPPAGGMSRRGSQVIICPQTATSPVSSQVRWTILSKPKANLSRRALTSRG